VKEQLTGGISISVPPRVQEAFWRLGWRQWCWLFRTQPAAREGDTITFRMNRKPVATAKIRVIAPPGTPRWRNRSRWVVAWDSNTFSKLADDDEEGFEPKLYGGYTWKEGSDAIRGDGADPVSHGQPRPGARASGRGEKRA
jgi:hypothetical protein